MPERDDAPDPMDEAYLRAEQGLDDEADRAARRARVLAGVAKDAAAPASPPPPRRRPFGRYGGWLAAAGVAGLSVVTASQVYRLAPRRQQIAPPTLAPSAPGAKAPAPPAVRPLPAAPPVRPSSPPPPVMASRRAPPGAEAVAPPPADVAPPPPLPIPPVEKPVQAPSPLIAETKPGSLAETAVAGATANARRAAPFAAASSAALSDSSAKARDGAAGLRAAAAAGRTAEIEALLARGVPVDAPDETGETALMKSIAAGQREAAALLRRRGASLDLKNRGGVSARDMALLKDDAELDQALGLTP